MLSLILLLFVFELSELIDFAVAKENLKHLFLSFSILKFSETARWKRKCKSRDYFLKTFSTGGAVCCKIEFWNYICVMRCLLNCLQSYREYYTCTKQIFFLSFSKNLSTVALDRDKTSKSQKGLLWFSMCFVSGQKSSKLCFTLP